MPVYQARQVEEQTTHYIRTEVAFNTAPSGTAVSFGAAIPKGAIVVRTIASIQTAFNAATTNVLIVGTAGDDDALVDAATAGASFDETSATLQTARPATLAGLLSATQDTEIFWKYTQSGTAATTGAATLIVEYIPNQ